MKLITVLVFTILHLTAQADESKMPLPSFGNAADLGMIGFRASILKPSLAIQVPGRDQTARLNEAVGMSVGYIDMAAGEMGWASSIGYIQGKDSQTLLTPNIVRADVNLGYTFNPIFSVRGGCNISGLHNAGIENLAPRLGLQMVGSARLYGNFSLDVGYINMNQGITDTLMVVNQSGFEVGLAGTF